MIIFKSAQEWEDWLSKNHERETEMWVPFAKKDTGVVTVTYAEAVDLALCYGWIDGLTNRVDDTYYKVRFTPRKAKSLWSARNREIIARLTKEKRMKPSGLAQVEAAKKDGRWDAAYASPKNMQVPDDFIKELSKDKKALAFYKTLNRTNTYAIAWRLATAKKPETRAARFKKLIEMLAYGQKLH
jgi:uncharacterized protein YdeI (YjbR/CyaY-like superfamily)